MVGTKRRGGSAFGPIRLFFLSFCLFSFRLFIASQPPSGRVQTSISLHSITPCVDFILDLLTIRQPVVKGMQRLAISLKVIGSWMSSYCAIAF
jgi:hypothetical protein